MNIRIRYFAAAAEAGSLCDNPGLWCWPVCGDACGYFPSML